MMIKKITSLKTILFIIAFIIFFYLLPLNPSKITEGSSQYNIYSPDLSVSGFTQSDIDSLIDDKLSDYSQYGCFEEYYTPSIRDTYFALYVLDTIGKLNQINESRIKDYIMNNYNASDNEFQDEYSLRFYDLQNTEAYYQNSPLLTYCYAVLSLIIINELDSLNQVDIFNFIWSCFDSNTGGFFGFPNPDSSPQNVSTGENTYFAVETLNELNIDWNMYASEKNQIGSFLGNLQIDNPLMPIYHGGFMNDLDWNVDTVIRYDPNIRSSYFAIFTLESLNMLNLMNNENFLQYLSQLYDSNSGCFFYNFFHISNRIYNVISTAFGIELADLVGYNYNRTLSVNFLLNSRMNNGGWPNSENVGNYEFIDTYEVIRYFQRTGDINLLNVSVKDQIYQFLLRFKQLFGFSSLSKDHTSLRTISNTVKSFALNSRIYDLDFQELFEIINSSHLIYYFGDLGEGTFYGPATTNLSSINYRTAPLEYKGTKNHNYSENIGFLHSAEHIFYAFSALEKIFKLDNFALESNLTEFLEHLIDCQFLDAGYERYGGFLPDYQFTMYSPDYYEDHIYLRYTYFTIKNIEILDTFLYDGNITNNGINLNALTTFISNRIIETTQYLYFNPYYSNNVNDIIENIYFMSYILKTFGIYALNTTKIFNFVIDNVDYTNFKGLYYLYKLSKLLDYYVDFDLDATRMLINDLYLDVEGEFLEFIDSEVVNTDILYWICDIAANDEIRINYNFDNPATIGYPFHINATLNNLVLDDFGQMATVKFEINELGNITLDQYGSNYEKDIYLDVNPNYFPKLYANLCVYKDTEKIIEQPIEIDTDVNIVSNHSYFNYTHTLDTYFEYTINTLGGYTVIPNAQMYVSVYLNSFFSENISLGSSDNGTHNIFDMSYQYTNWGNYTFEFYVIHPFLNEVIYNPNIGKRELSLNTTVKEPVIFWEEPSEGEHILFGMGDAIFNFTYDSLGVDYVFLSINGINCGNVWNLNSTILSYSSQIDGAVTAILHGFFNNIEMTNSSRDFVFGKVSINQTELVDKKTEFIGDQIYLILHDPSGDNSYSSFTSGSIMSLGVGCQIINGTTQNIEIVADFGLFSSDTAMASPLITANETYIGGFDFRFEILSLDSFTSSKQKLDSNYIGPGYGDIYWGESWVFKWELKARNITYFNGTSIFVEPKLVYGINRTAEVFLSDYSAPQEWRDLNPAHNGYNGVTFFRNVLLEGSSEIQHTDMVSETIIRNESFNVPISESAKNKIGGIADYLTIKMTEKNYGESSYGQWIETSYYLLDDEAGDRIYMDIGLDPNFGTYVFNTSYFETETSQPLEYNTTDYIPPLLDIPTIIYDSSGDGIGPCEDDSPIVTVNVFDESEIQLALIHFSINNGSNWDSALLTEQIANPGVWSGSISSQENGVSVLWYLEAWDSAGLKTTRKDQNNDYFNYIIGNRPPIVILNYPNGGEFLQYKILVQWFAYDPDSDFLRYTLAYNIENTGWHSIATDIYNTSFEWNVSDLQNSNSVLLRITALDEFGGEASDNSDFVFTIASQLPTGTILLNNGDEYTTTPSITLTITSVTGTEFRTSNDYYTWSFWETFSSIKNYNLSAGDGITTVYIQFKDKFGLISEDLIYDSIILDTIEPIGSIVINNDDLNTTENLAFITINTQDINRVTEMRFSNDSFTWTKWESYSEYKNLSLPFGEGIKTIYAQFKDSAGLISSDVISDEILLVSKENSEVPLQIMIISIIPVGGMIGIILLKRRKVLTKSDKIEPLKKLEQSE